MKLSELISKINDFLKHELPQFKELVNIKSRNELLKNIKFLYESKGVYVFEHNTIGIVYIGSSGKINRDKENNSENCKNGIGSRLIRSSTPYCFVDKKLCYKKKKNSDSKKTMENYNESFPLDDVKIYYVKTNELPFNIPTVLEHLLIQVFSQNGELPIINNQL